MDAVLLNNVSKSFGDVHAVDRLSVSVPTGAIYGFLGPNGAGKTTTLRMIMNIIRPDSGKIELLGSLPLTRAAERIGYMPEERGLYRKMTVAGVLSYFAAIKGLTKREIADRVPRWLERIQLADYANKKVEELSRGMHQKLQFAVTAINDPQLLILDEPFSGLDPINTDLLKTIVLDMRQQGKTVIFSTHVMHEAERLCDSILLINKGRAILDDSLARIQAQHKSDAVSIEIEDTDPNTPENHVDFIRRMPMVQAVEPNDNSLDISLTQDANPQQLLKALAERVPIRRFEVKVPSLHEIFVSMVGTSNEQDS